MRPAQNSPIESSLSRIPARSRRRAMDWSLVLASQGIEAVIKHDPDAGWALEVPATEYIRAMDAIHQYRTENLRWPWRKPVTRQRLVFDWGSAIWCLLAAFFYWTAKTPSGLQQLGIMDTTSFAHGQWWRLWTAMWLHADTGHLAANVGFGFILLGLAMGQYGTGVGFLAAYLAGAAGNLGDWLVYGGGHQSLGASGMVMAALGLIAARSFSERDRWLNARRFAIGSVAAGVMLFILVGLAPGTDIVAHFGGFAAGLLCGAVLSFFPRLANHAAANLVAGLLSALLVVLPWGLAMDITK